jgi:hypothetical protein
MPIWSRLVMLFRLLSEPKRLQVYEGGHVPPTETYVPSVRKWLDETLGAVE